MTLIKVVENNKELKMSNELTNFEKFDAYYRLIRPEVAQLIKSDYHKVLEIGCGEGNFRKNLILPHEYWGVEPNVQAANIAKNNCDKVLVGFYEQIHESIPNQYFDLIICCDVIEHIYDTEFFLYSLSEKIDLDNGEIIFSIPNVRYYNNIIELLVYKDWKYAVKGILDKTHLRFFTQKSIIRLFEENNFKIKEIVGLNPIGGRKRILINIFKPFIGDMQYFQFGVVVSLNKKK
jgi:2-polyprenyl-3-methyl-5-hydroxy-6-metoxy-1,4-benzoquinol methylase